MNPLFLRRVLRPLPVAALLSTLISTAGSGQERRVEAVRTADGVTLDFGAQMAWRAKTQRVARFRQQLLAAGRLGELNAAVRAGAASGTAAVAGTFRLPSVLVAFSDTDTSALPQASRYDSLFYTPQSIAGRPYTLRTLYQEMSNGLLSIDGATYGWFPGPNSRSYYLDACGTSASALDCPTGRQRLRELLLAALSALDPSVDFGQYDNDGPDGIPNSGDDDGIVDLVQFLQPVVGGECGGRGYWAHKFQLSDLVFGSGPFTTDDPAAGGGSIKIDPYYIVAGVGGPSCTDSRQIMAIGTAAHELGHGLGLPDLYDTGGSTHGIGEWGLMGSGNYTSLVSPAHFEAWSKERLGWVLVRELTEPGTYELGPVVLSDTVFLIRPVGSNPRGEYFLLENKQAHGSDTSNMQTGGKAGPKRGGLLVWHIDSAKVAVWPASNTVNSGAVHGVALEEADGMAHLWKQTGGNRGDSGDPYPGSAGALRFSFDTNPAALKNHDGGFVGWEIDSVVQLAPAGAVRFALRFGTPTLVHASDTVAEVIVDGARYRKFSQILVPGSVHTVSIDSVQLAPDSSTRFVFDSWSDGGARTHEITARVEGDTLIAAVSRWYRIRVAVTGGGEVQSDPALDLGAGGYLPEGSPVAVWAIPKPDSVFEGWSGDTAATADTLHLAMRRPYQLTATFLPRLIADAGTPAEAVRGRFYRHQLEARGGTGSYRWTLAGGSLPAGLALGSYGLISGTPAEPGVDTVVVRVTSGSQQAEVSLVLTVREVLTASAGTPPGPVMGKPYAHSLTASGGTGSYSWRLVQGELPPGLSLDGAGTIAGIPEATGRFVAVTRVVSGSQQAELPVELTVTAPPLATSTVVSQLLGTASRLNADELRYLDLLGNRNGSFDVGDFLAWVEATGAPSSVLGPVLERAGGAGGRKP
ncbi:Immune inhibitor A [bacterium HR33]|nr:Immune inhibitor A [bacterium HR33]